MSYYGYRFSDVVGRPGSKATHDGPIALEKLQDVTAFIRDNIEKYPELRITDDMDLCVIHIIEQKLQFPLADGHREPCPWDKTKNWFK